MRLPNAIDATKWGDHGGTKDELRRQLGLPLDTLIVLYAGRLSERKGLNLLYSAWPGLASDGPKLLLLGRRPALDGLPEFPFVLVHEWAENVSDYYRASDVFVLPSLAEGMSNALLEAMASGLPVIATRVGAAEEVIKDGVTGLLVEPGNASQLTEALRVLLTDSVLRKRLGDAGAADVQRRFAVQQVLDGIVATYNSILLR